MLYFDAYPHMLGGAQRSTLLLADGLQRMGWDVTVATPGPGPYVDALGRAGIRHLDWPLPAALRVYGHQTTGRQAVVAVAALPGTWRRAARALRGRFDIVHTVDHRAQILLGPGARRAGIPVVWHVHNIERSRLVNRFARRFADRVVVPSGFLGRMVADRPAGPGASTGPGAPAGSAGPVVIPNALPDDVLGWATGPPPPTHTRIVSVGRLDPQKGYETLLEALHLMRQRGVDARGVIAGPTATGLEGYARTLRAERDRLELQGVVDFVGPVDDVAALLAAGGVYVQPSRWEVQPLAVMEAMAVGLAVVATRVGATEELLGGGARGILVDPEDPAGLADGITEALEDAAGRSRRIDAARRYIVEVARADRMVDQVQEVYRSL